MEKKNMVLLTVIAVATLLVAVVGATFAYFTATVQDTRETKEGQGQTTLNTATLASQMVVANIEGAAGKFEANDIYPGHMEVAGMKVTITGEGNFVIPFEYNVTANTISTKGGTVNYYLYKDDTASINNFTSEKLGCSVKTTEGDENEVRYSEKCTFTNAESSGNSPTGVDDLQSLKLVTKGTLKAAGGTETIDMLDTVSDVSSSKDVNYYFVVEYEETNNEQNSQEGQSLEGTITIAGAKAVSP